MSLAKRDVIDIVMVAPDKQTVALIAFDDGQLPGGESREEALHQKLLTYLNFVVSGQFIEDHPEHADRGVKIVVLCVYPPSDAMKQVQGIREHAKPETNIPVEVVSEAEFFADLQAQQPRPKPKPKSWWRWWS